MVDRQESAEIALMTEIATLYYVEGETQEAIAQRLDMSRIKVGRIIKRAHAVGIVDVRVRHHPSVSAEIETALIERFGIKRALIALDHTDPERQRSEVASLVADHLTRNLSDGSMVAVGMGRAVADNVFTGARPPSSAATAKPSTPPPWCSTPNCASSCWKTARYAKPRPGILGALRTGAIDTLATSSANALTVLSLDDATRKKG